MQRPRSLRIPPDSAQEVKTLNYPPFRRSISSVTRNLSSVGRACWALSMHACLHATKKTSYPSAQHGYGALTVCSGHPDFVRRLQKTKNADRGTERASGCMCILYWKQKQTWECKRAKHTFRFLSYNHDAENKPKKGNMWSTSEPQKAQEVKESPGERHKTSNEKHSCVAKTKCKSTQKNRK